MAKLNNTETLALIVNDSVEAVNSLDTARIACIADWAQGAALKAAQGNSEAKAALWEIVAACEVKGISKQGPVVVAIRLIEHIANPNTSEEVVEAVSDMLRLETKAAALFESTQEATDEEIHEAATQSALEESDQAPARQMVSRMVGDQLTIENVNGNWETFSWAVMKGLLGPDATVEDLAKLSDVEMDAIVQRYHLKMERAALVSSLSAVQRKMHGMFKSLEAPVGDHFKKLVETRKGDNIEKAAEFAFQLLNKLGELFRSSKKKLDANDVGVASDELPLIDQYLKTLWVLAQHWNVTNNARPYPVRGFSQEELAQIKVPMPAGKVAVKKEESVNKGAIPSAVQVDKPTEDKAVVIARPETTVETNKQEPKAAQKEESMGKKQKAKEIEIVTPQLVEAIGNMPVEHQQQIRHNIVAHIREVLGTELMGGKEVFGWKELRKNWETLSDEDRTKVLTSVGSTDEVRSKILDVSQVEIKSDDDNKQGPSEAHKEKQVNETKAEAVEQNVENKEGPTSVQEEEKMEIVEETKRPTMPEGAVEVKTEDEEKKPGAVKKATEAMKTKAVAAYKASTNLIVAALVAADNLVVRSIGPSSRYTEIEKKAAAMAVDSYSLTELALPKSPVGAFLKSLFEKIARTDTVDAERELIKSELKHNKAEAIALMMLVSLRFGMTVAKGERHITKKIAQAIAADATLSPMAKKVKNDKTYLKLHTQYLQGVSGAEEALTQLDEHRVELAQEQIGAFAAILNSQTIDGSNKLTGTKKPEVLHRKAFNLFAGLSDEIRELSMAMQRRLATITKPKQLKIGGFERTKKVLWVAYETTKLVGAWITLPVFSVVNLLTAGYYGVKSLFKKGQEKAAARAKAGEELTFAGVLGGLFIAAPVFAIPGAISYVSSFFKKGDGKVLQNDKAFGPRTKAEADADKGIVAKMEDLVMTHKAEVAGIVAGGTLGGIIMGGLGAVAATAVVAGAAVYGIKKLVGWWKSRKPVAKAATPVVEGVSPATVAA